jgi:hypothetical protein
MLTGAVVDDPGGIVLPVDATSRRRYTSARTTWIARSLAGMISV